MRAAAFAVPAMDPAEDVASYRRSLGAFPTGITVMTGAAGDLRAGVTANSFGSVSLDPALVLWSLKIEAPSLPVFRAGGRFAVNVLSWHQEDLCRHFAMPHADKFDGVAHSAGLGGVPLLDGCSTNYECRVVHEFVQGDHVVLIGQVERFRDFHREPLVFYRGTVRGVDQPILT